MHIVCIVEESDRQLRLRDETIYNLKLENSSLKEEKAAAVLRLEQINERNATLMAENEQLRNQLLIKYETGKSHKN